MNEDLLRYIEEWLLEDHKHTHYDRCVKLAKTYNTFITGKGMDDMLQRIVTRESKEMFDQRVKITKHVVPSILNSLKMPCYKVCRTIPLVRKIDWLDDNGNENRLEDLSKSMGTYWGGKGLEEYLEWSLVDFALIDPNAFSVTEFAAFDAKREKAKPYPVIFESKQVIDFEYKNNILQHLVVSIDYPIVVNGLERTEQEYIIYRPYVGYRVTPIIEDVDGVIIRKGTKRWVVTEFNHGSEHIQAERIGYIPDMETKGETYISFYHMAIPLLEKTLKINSELDLSAAMVAFPQRFAYAQKCTAAGCNKGVDVATGNPCKVCHGTGVAHVHGSTADVQVLPLPDNPEDMYDLTRLLHYVMPPIELLEFQDRYIEKMKTWVYSTVFNSDIFTRSEISETATAKILESDNMNDTLYPFARHYSAFWCHVIGIIATFTDLGSGIILQHKFPHNIRFKTLGDLMSELRTAKDSGASSATVAAIEDDINDILYIDRPDELRKIRVKNAFNPFRGFDSQRIALTIGTGRTTKYNEILYLNLENIFQELEREVKEWIYDKPMDVIDSLVRGKVAEIQQRLDDEKPSVNLRFDEYETEV